MKKFLPLIFIGLLAACNSSEPAKTDATKPASDTATAMREINSPYKVTYSSKFEIADPKYAEAILTLWKDWDNGNVGAHKELFADSLYLRLADGTTFWGSRDSAVAFVQAGRNRMSASVDRVDAVTSVRSTDKNENWALIWGLETDTHKDGKVDSVNLQETWRFNKDGKADLLFQFQASATPPKAKK